MVGRLLIAVGLYIYIILPHTVGFGGSDDDGYGCDNYYRPNDDDINDDKCLVMSDAFLFCEGDCPVGFLRVNENAPCGK